MRGHGEDTFFSPAPAIPQSSFQLTRHVTRLVHASWPTLLFLFIAGHSVYPVLPGAVSLTQSCVNGPRLLCSGSLYFLDMGSFYSFISFLLFMTPSGCFVGENSARDLTFPVRPLTLMENSHSHQAQASNPSECCCQDDGSRPS